MLGIKTQDSSWKLKDAICLHDILPLAVEFCDVCTHDIISYKNSCCHAASVVVVKHCDPRRPALRHNYKQFGLVVPVTENTLRLCG